ncbi:MAG: hypothetical protein QUU85_01605, partial [Candidatus Eisenbacteria bacterium]|nr:hypothetical protein [Candidatus Eisenbacteria bacterium]
GSEMCIRDRGGDVGRYRWRQFWQGLRRNSTYGVFVRISTLETPRAGEAEAWNERFLSEVVKLLPSLIRE